MNVYRHSGDLGDILAALPVIRQMGGGQLILGNVNGIGAREPMTSERYNAIAPLIQIQPYISALSFEHDAKGVTHDLSAFRSTPMRSGEAHNLVNWQADFFKCGEVDLSPWLHNVYGNEEATGKTIFARTTRYLNPSFDWRHAADSYPNAMFVGFEDEWKALCLTCGRQIPWRQTATLLEVAELIKGSERLISNQNVHCWIAMGLGHPLIQESDANNLNSIIRRDNAQFVLGRYP